MRLLLLLSLLSALLLPSLAGLSAAVAMPHCAEHTEAAAHDVAVVDDCHALAAEQAPSSCENGHSCGGACLVLAWPMSLQQPLVQAPLQPMLSRPLALAPLPHWRLPRAL